MHVEAHVTGHGGLVRPGSPNQRQELIDGADGIPDAAQHAADKVPQHVVASVVVGELERELEVGDRHAGRILY
jgi:hypothetical protein